MEAIAKYISWILVVIVAIHGAVTTYLPDNKKLAWLNAKKWRIVFCHSSIFAAVFTILASYLGDMSSETRQRDLDDKLSQAGAALEDANRKADEANKKLDESLKVNKGLLDLVSEQSKSMSSLVFNMETSLEGKARFARNFEALSLLAKFDDKQYEYCSQVCNDGVAVFWFERKTEELRGFYFFSNAKINEVLSYMPLDESFISADGTIAVGKEKELFTIFSKCFQETIPQKSRSAVAQLKVSNTIDVMLKEILYYVYRAIPGSASVRSYKYEDRDLLSEDRLVSFSYYVDPLAQKPIVRSVRIDLTKHFIGSLYGISRKEFNERVIEKFRAFNLEAKVTPVILSYLSNREVRKKSGEEKIPISMARASIRPDSQSVSIVGYELAEIKKGVNKVDISFCSIGIFPTLNKIIKFSPTEALVGDTITFFLDGKRCEYKIESWDEKVDDFVIVSTSDKSLSRTSLASIPYVKSIWISHKKDVVVNVTNSGMTAGKNLKHVKSLEVSQIEGTVVPARINVKMVDSPGEN